MLFHTSALETAVVTCENSKDVDRRAQTRTIFCPDVIARYGLAQREPCSVALVTARSLRDNTDRSSAVLS